ncbi:DUF1641 domain-containing protein [Paenibacillus harenae]|uniref:Uncharacterized protein YjgD (DUF1641 family) n=1 Tax=Paenibacillus harenae TaxID=306543 RepID=A0ABT9U172_PAEHA|nr:DUF1641 domain-containing protein [Paenibacillus harenae]MDQ0061761.1 uncharacterized protein YjgD (DUF1641 family) [Paenibacillus harenae]MDQ0113385.1 uncharacterized protein YjgD (DUF1641 family) [Paenibacillus harenae]
MSQPTAQQEVSANLAEEKKSLDVLDQLMQPEVQNSLTVLVDNLPKLAEMVTAMTAAYDFAKGIATDKVLINDFAQGIGEFVKPVQEKAKGIAQAAIEAGERSQADTSSTVGLFAMLKMLKDPEVQKTLRFAQAFLNVLAEKKNS